MTKTDRIMFIVSIPTRKRFGKRIYKFDSVYTTKKEAEKRVEKLRKNVCARMVKGAKHLKTGKPGYYVYKFDDLW